MAYRIKTKNYEVSVSIYFYFRFVSKKMTKTTKLMRSEVI